MGQDCRRAGGDSTGVDRAVGVFRNEILLKQVWVDHYAGLGLDFPNAPVNGMVWGVWSLLFAIGIRAVLGRFEFWSGVVLAWFMWFVLMWVVTGNMAVLPVGILVFAVPLSLLEVAIAAMILRALGRNVR